MMPEISDLILYPALKADVRTKGIPLIVCTSSEFTEKNLEELNNELKGHLISIIKRALSEEKN